MSSMTLPPPRARSLARARNGRLLRRATVSRLPTEVILVRHASHNMLGKMLLGRLPGVSLNDPGLAEAQQLAEQLVGRGISRVQSSPRQQSLETAQIIADTARVPLDINFGLDGMDFGAWTGLSFKTLSRNPAWRRWNILRSLCQPPDGESLADVRARILRHLGRVHATHPGRRVVLVSHGEVLQTVLMHCRGLSIDDFVSVEIAPASVVMLSVTRHGAELMAAEQQH